MKEGSSLHIGHSRMKHAASNIRAQAINVEVLNQNTNHLKVCCRLLQPSLGYCTLDHTKLDYSLLQYTVYYTYCIYEYHTMYILIVYFLILYDLCRGVAFGQNSDSALLCQSETNKERDSKGLCWWEDAWVLHQNV